jgi:lysozyme
MKDLLIPLLKRHEGLRLTAYRCTEGVLTIGYGHTGVDVKEGLTITKEHAEELLVKDMEIAEKDARLFNYYHKLDPVRQAVIVNMLFNLGLFRFKKFLRFNMAMSKGNFDVASQEMMSSRWARQVGDGPGGKFDRAEELSKIMLTGKL